MNNKKTNVLLLGIDSEIGLQLHELFLKKKFKVFASTKMNKSKSNFFYLDYNKLNGFKNIAKKKFKNIKFDYVIFLAAITNSSKQIDNKKCTFGNIDYQNFSKILKINCYSQIKIFEILKMNNFINNNARIIFFSSLAGSITNRGSLKHNKPFGNMIYRVSKAALNCAVKNLSYDFSQNNIIVSLHPGFIKTKRVGQHADLDIKYASNKILKTILSLKKNMNGKFLNYNGSLIKW